MENVNILGTMLIYSGIMLLLSFCNAAIQAIYMNSKGYETPKVFTHFAITFGSGIITGIAVGLIMIGRMIK